MHSTVTYNGDEHALFGTRFEILKDYPVSSELINFSDKNDEVVIEAKIPSYIKRYQVEVFRKIVLKNNDIIIEDLVNGKQKHNLHSKYIIGSDVDISINENSINLDTVILTNINKDNFLINDILISDRYGSLKKAKQLLIEGKNPKIKIRI